MAIEGQQQRRQEAGMVAIRSRLKEIEPLECQLAADLHHLAVFFARVGHNQRWFKENKPRKVDGSGESSLKEPRRVFTLQKKYDLKMALDERLQLVWDHKGGTKLRLFNLAWATDVDCFMRAAAHRRPLDFSQELFWNCTGNGEFLAKHREFLLRNDADELDSHQNSATFCKRSPSRLLTLAILPLLTRNESSLATICALVLEIRLGRVNLDRFKHYRRECYRHIMRNEYGRAEPQRKEFYRKKYAIEEAEKQLKWVHEEDVLRKWSQLCGISKLAAGAILTTRPSAVKGTSSEKCTSPAREAANLPVVVGHADYLRKREPDDRVRAKEIQQLIGHFTCSIAPMQLLDSRCRERHFNSELRAVAYKYYMVYSGIGCSLHLSGTLVRVHRFVHDHLMLFLDAAGEENKRDFEEETFWWCCGNIKFWRHNSEQAQNCKRGARKLALSPSRLVSMGAHFLLTQDEPQLLTMNALRAALDSRGRRLSKEKYEGRLKMIKMINEQLGESQRELVKELRSRYAIQGAEMGLRPVCVDLFMRRWNDNLLVTSYN